MKRSLLALLLCAALLLPMFCLPAAADEKLSFISINDTLPPELIGCVADHGGTTYVPYYIFTNYGFGFSYSYNADEAVACLSRGDRKIFFEPGTGVTYDSDNYKYSASAIMRSGTVYVPLSFTARFFGGISYSSIAGNEYGSILRITDGTEVLTDAEFLRAAKTVMRSYAAAYQGDSQGPLSPDETELTPHEGEQIDLSLIGLPSEAVLARLNESRISSCFFLTADDVRTDPDMVRRLVCGGHSVGVYCTENLASEYAETSDLLFAAARVCTELVTAAPEYAETCRAHAGMAGLVYCEFAIETAGLGAYSVTSRLEAGSGGTALLLDGSADAVDSLGILLNYLRNGKFNAGAPREVG